MPNRKHNNKNLEAFKNLPEKPVFSYEEYADKTSAESLASIAAKRDSTGDSITSLNSPVIIPSSEKIAQYMVPSHKLASIRETLDNAKTFTDLLTTLVGINLGLVISVFTEYDWNANDIPENHIILFILILIGIIYVSINLKKQNELKIKKWDEIENLFTQN
jgi:uncharacterized protein YacL